MPNLIKIGKTSQADPRVRMDQLFTSGVPVPFVCEIAVQVEDEVAVESALHLTFAPQRINPRREFFELDADQVRVILDLVAESDVTPVVLASDSEIDEESKEAGQRLKSCRPNLNLDEMGIALGSELHPVNGGDTATVESARQVRFANETMSLTQATKLSLGVEYAVGPAAHWRFEGRLLRDIYNETYH